MSFLSRGRLTAVLSLALLLVLTGCTSNNPNADQSAASSVPDQSQTDVSSEQAADNSQTAVAEPAPLPSDSSESEVADVPSAPVEAPALSPSGAYDFTQPAPESDPVDNSYFQDAAFVGDSRTDGFLIYSGIGQGKNLTSNGLSIFKLAEKKALKIDGKDYTLLEALGLEQYSKVYLSLGINELGFYDDQGFYDSYCKAIDSIRAIQPNAVIYIQGLIPLNEQRVAETSKRDYLKNDHLRIYNDLMRQAAQEKQVVFLDLYNAFADENDSLPYEASKDGVHLNGDYCKKWLAYLQTHTVAYDDLYSTASDQAAS